VAGGGQRARERRVLHPGAVGVSSGRGGHL